MVPRRSANPSRGRALTLIEVVAALALLALVLGAAVGTRGRLVRSGVAARERRLAVAALNEALDAWWAAGARFDAGLGPGRDDPAGAGRSGVLPLSAGGADGPAPTREWVWRSVAVAEPALLQRGLLRVRVAAGPAPGRGGHAVRPLVVDVLVPREAAR